MTCRHCRTSCYVPRVVDNRQMLFHTCGGMREDRALIGLDHTMAPREMIVLGGLRRTGRRSR